MMSNYPDGYTGKRHDAAQGRDDAPEHDEPPYNADAARRYWAYMADVKREAEEERLRILGRVG